MNIEYFLSVRPGTDEFHSIHKESCPFLDYNKNKILLGNFRSAAEALCEGQKHYIKTKCCSFCSKEEVGARQESIVSRMFEQILICDGTRTEKTIYQDLVCCIN